MVLMSECIDSSGISAIRYIVGIYSEHTYSKQRRYFTECVRIAWKKRNLEKTNLLAMYGFFFTFPSF